ncbi:hypothetical protein CF326_g1675 [Tilletia indica]|nr:hypothetical protein CF326_g1675 [Tilletia indica]
MASFHMPGKQQVPSSPSSSSSKPTAASGTGAADQDRHAQNSKHERAGNGPMMFLGQQCFWHECHREDFLPFKCVDCTHHFCAEHFRPQQHSCAAAAAHDAAEDFRVPLCPICNEPPQNWRRGEDPNIAMERHLSSGQCPALDGGGLLREGNGLGKPAGSGGIAQRSSGSGSSTPRAKKANECHFHRCHKIMIVPMHCAACNADFCPSHRAPVQHTCASKEKANSGSAGQSRPPAAAGRSDESGIRAARGAFLKKLADSMPGSTPSNSPSKSSSAAVNRPTPPPAIAAESSKPSSSTATSETTSGAGRAGIGGGLFKTKAERYVDVVPSPSSQEGGEAEKTSSGRATSSNEGGSGSGSGPSEEELAKESAWSPFLIPSVTSFAPPALFVPSPRA